MLRRSLAPSDLALKSPFLTTAAHDRSSAEFWRMDKAEGERGEKCSFCLPPKKNRLPGPIAPRQSADPLPKCGKCGRRHLLPDHEKSSESYLCLLRRVPIARRVRVLNEQSVRLSPSSP